MKHKIVVEGIGKELRVSIQSQPYSSCAILLDLEEAHYLQSELEVIINKIETNETKEQYINRHS